MDSITRKAANSKNFTAVKDSKVVVMVNMRSRIIANFGVSLAGNLKNLPRAFFDTFRFFQSRRNREM